MINWIDISKNEIHGSLYREVSFILKREENHPYFWNMVGLCDGRSQYRNDLKSEAEHFVNNL